MAAPAGLTNLVVPQESAPKGRRCADFLARAIEQTGVQVIFGLPGGAISPLHDAFLDRTNVRVITTRHEAGAVLGAASFSRHTQLPGFALVTSGPGFFNSLNALASAHCDSLPVVLLVGEVARPLHGRRALQEGTSHHLDVIGMVRHLTKYAAQVPSAASAPYMLDEAIRRATTGRPGPVMLTLPVDVGMEDIDPPILTRKAAQRQPPEPYAIADVCACIASAKRGAILAGSGANWNASSALMRLAEHIQWPVLCTPKGKGALPETHPLSLGVFGHGGHPSAREYLEPGLDCLIVVGSSLNDAATDGWSALLSAPTFVHIDCDATQMGRNYAPTHGLVGDATGVVDAMLETLPRASSRASYGVRRHEIVEHRTPGLMAPHEAISELQRWLPDDAMFTCDIGEHLMFATHYLEAKSPRQFSIMSGLGSMGTAIPSAIGAKLARSSDLSVALCGDGGFVMSLTDLVTAAAEQVPVVIAVLNDERYGMVELGHEQVYGRRARYPAGPIDLSLLARGSGARGYLIRSADDFRGVELPITSRGTPVVLDIRIDPQIQMPKGTRNKTLASRANGS